HLAVLIVAAWAVVTPWTVRNMRLTGHVIPASAHGGIQLWYGSLQQGPFYPNWFDNPRQVYGERTFPSSRPDGRPLVMSSVTPIPGGCAGGVPQTVGATYWTDRDPTRVTVAPRTFRDGGVHVDVPPQVDATAVYYYFDATWTSPHGVVAQQSPIGGPLNPAV